MESKYSPTSIQAATAKVLKLFAEFKSEYGDLFEYKKHRYTSAKAREWAVELLESGINAEQYQYGRYQAVKNQKYPIERGYDFIQLCKQAAATEYPSAQAAFDNACCQCGLIEDQYVKRKWLHAVVLETANRIGWGKLKAADNYFLKTFTGVYEQVIAEHKNGAEFAQPKSHRIEQQHVPVQESSPFNAQLDAFFAKYGSKGGAV